MALNRSFCSFAFISLNADITQAIQVLNSVTLQSNDVDTWNSQMEENADCVIEALETLRNYDCLDMIEIAHMSLWMTSDDDDFDNHIIICGVSYQQMITEAIKERCSVSDLFDLKFANRMDDEEQVDAINHLNKCLAL
jgi:hypothetical protein